MIYTLILAVAGVAIAMLLIGLGVLLGKRTPLKRSCAAGAEQRGDNAACPDCSCGSGEELGIDSHRQTM